MHEQCTSNSPNPLTRNEAKTKLRTIAGKFIYEELNVKLNNKIISDDDLLHFFTHEEGASFFLKKEYTDHNKVISFIVNNQNKFSFLQPVNA